MSAKRNDAHRDAAMATSRVSGAAATNAQTRQLLTLAMLALGAVLWGLIGLTGQAGPGIGWKRSIVITVAGALACIPPISRAIAAGVEPLRAPSPRQRAKVALAIAVVSTLYFICTAIWQDRDLFPKTLDDQSYLIQMQMLARGHLWMPQHPLADFFDTFYVLVRPTYASMYFHGAALMYVPTVWLHLPTWVMPVIVAGAIVGLTYRIVTELADGFLGALAALMLVSLSWFRIFSILLTSHEPMLLLGLLMVWAWLRWRGGGMKWGRQNDERGTMNHESDLSHRSSLSLHRSQTPPHSPTSPAPRFFRWLLLVGIFAGWAAITRPVDALCFAVPVGLGIAADLRRAPGRQWLLAAGCIVVGAAPFLALQAVANRGVTGDWLTSPFRLYIEQSQPGTAFGFAPYDPHLRPQSSLPQKQDYYEQFYVPRIQAHQTGTFLKTWLKTYLPMTADTALPARFLLVFLPAGLLALAGRPRIVFGAVLPMFIVLYVGYAVFLEHYALLVAPALICSVLSGGRAIEQAWPSHRRTLHSAFLSIVVALCLSVLPETRPLFGEIYKSTDETFFAPELRQLREFAPDPGKRVVILFHYTRKADNVFGWVNHEPVYNTDVAWPDNAPVIRAHDLGPLKNRQIFEYYAQRQPDRFFYRMDLATGLYEELGTARDLAENKMTAETQRMQR